MDIYLIIPPHKRAKELHRATHRHFSLVQEHLYLKQL